VQKARAKRKKAKGKKMRGPNFFALPFSFFLLPFDLIRPSAFEQWRPKFGRGEASAVAS
jgi:hypothetical protein